MALRERAVFGQRGKREYVLSIFERIAPYYDKMNLLISWGLLRTWQSAVLAEAKLPAAARVLDVGTGTGELALMLAEETGSKGEVIGLDLSEAMLRIAAGKVKKQGISFIQGDALQLPFGEESFDCVTTGFALRNVTDILRAVSEMRRVCKKGGRVVCLEVSEPENRLWRAGFRLYYYGLIPLLGQPYAWLAQSLQGFPQGGEMKRIFRESGLSDVRCRKLHGGIVTIYSGIKTGPDKGDAWH